MWLYNSILLQFDRRRVNSLENSSSLLDTVKNPLVDILTEKKMVVDRKTFNK